MRRVDSPEDPEEETPLTNVSGPYSGEQPAGLTRVSSLPVHLLYALRPASPKPWRKCLPTSSPDVTQAQGVLSFIILLDLMFTKTD